MSTTRRTLIAGALAIGLAGVVGVAPAVALVGVEVNVDAEGVALHGYDPVAYFTDGKPTVGSAELTASHGGATYRFASAANRDAFKAAPGKYAPQYGGYCALGTTLGRKLDGDPDQWKIHEGKLYLNVNGEAQRYWSTDIPGNIVTADKVWPTIKDVPAAKIP